MTHYYKDFSIDVVTDLLLLTLKKDDCYDAILVIIVCLIKMVDYKLVKTRIDTTSLAKIIVNVIIKSTALSSKLWLLKASCLSQSSDLCQATFSVLSENVPLYFIYRQTTKPSDKIAQSRLHHMFLLIRNRRTGQYFCLYQNLYTATLKMRVLAICLSS